LRYIVTVYNIGTCTQRDPVHFYYFKEENKVNALHTNTVKLLARFIIIFPIFILSSCALFWPHSSLEGEEIAVAEHDYLIGPGDDVDIIVWRNPEVSMSVQVRPDGKITSPLVEDLAASGKTSTQLARDIEEALTKYIQQPVVTIIVRRFIGPYNEQVRVVGEASEPKALAYRENMTVMDVMIAVGGLTDFADGNGTMLIRTINGEKQEFRIRLHDLLRDGDISANVQMQQGDILVIPESFF
jgi:polysaccharide export outer membrane protein